MVTEDDTGHYDLDIREKDHVVEVFPMGLATLSPTHAREGHQEWSRKAFLVITMWTSDKRTDHMVEALPPTRAREGHQEWSWKALLVITMRASERRTTWLERPPLGSMHYLLHMPERVIKETR